MRAKAKTSSFEPRHLREAQKELERIERHVLLDRQGSAGERLPGTPDGKAPGLLLRWWRMLFGHPA
jgi:hypothetical protein